MISHIKGTITHVTEKRINIEAGKSGLSLDIQVPNTASYIPGKESNVFIYMHWNPEQGPSLYGFNTQLDKTVFTLIISCSGIGPKLGLNILAQMDASTFTSLIVKEDIKALSSLNGIGKKKAEQIIVQLKHKVSDLMTAGVELSTDSFGKHWPQIQEVLLSLNYSRQEIASAHAQIKISYDENESFDQLLRKSLSYLSKS